MADLFSSHSLDLAAPAVGAFSIAPSDATLFDQPTRAIYVGVGGSLAVEMLSGGSVFFEGLPAGSLLPVRVRRVLAASTASFLVGLY